MKGDTWTPDHHYDLRTNSKVTCNTWYGVGKVAPIQSTQDVLLPASRWT